MPSLLHCQQGTVLLMSAPGLIPLHLSPKGFCEGDEGQELQCGPGTQSPFASFISDMLVLSIYLHVTKCLGAKRQRG